MGLNDLNPGSNMLGVSVCLAPLALLFDEEGLSKSLALELEKLSLPKEAAQAGGMCHGYHCTIDNTAGLGKAACRR